MTPIICSPGKFIDHCIMKLLSGVLILCFFFANPSGAFVPLGAFGTVKSCCEVGGNKECCTHQKERACGRNECILRCHTCVVNASRDDVPPPEFTPVQKAIVQVVLGRPSKVASVYWHPPWFNILLTHVHVN